jgi:hypothetical protein
MWMGATVQLSCTTVQDVGLSMRKAREFNDLIHGLAIALPQSLYHIGQFRNIGGKAPQFLFKLGRVQVIMLAFEKCGHLVSGDEHQSCVGMPFCRRIDDGGFIL